MARKLSILLFISLLLWHVLSCMLVIFLSVTSPQVCSFHKIKWSFCVACGNRLLETNQGPISHICRAVIGATSPSKWLHKSVLGVGWSLLLTSGLVSCLLLSGRGCWLDSLSLSRLMFSECWVNSFCCAASEHTSSVEHGDQPNLPCKGGALQKKCWSGLIYFDLCQRHSVGMAVLLLFFLTLTRAVLAFM